MMHSLAITLLILAVCFEFLSRDSEPPPKPWMMPLKAPLNPRANSQWWFNLIMMFLVLIVLPMVW